MVYRTGGGVGTDLSKLRPEGAPVNATIDHSPGGTAFMNLFSESTNTVSQAGRRGALMLILEVWHPDVIDFINSKKEAGKITNANISVGITDDFMKAVKEDADRSSRFTARVTQTRSSSMVNVCPRHLRTSWLKLPAKPSS